MMRMAIGFVISFASLGSAALAQLNFDTIDASSGAGSFSGSGGSYVVRHGNDLLAVDCFGDTYTWSTATASFAANGASAVNPGSWYAFTSRAGVAMGWSSIAQDLIEWDGSQWTSVSWGGTPPAAYSAILAGDDTGKALLWGGLDQWTNAPMTETWILDASNNWSQLNPVTDPAWVLWPAYGSDPSGNVLMFGGNDNASPTPGFTGDTWFWNGSDWSLLVAAGLTTPPARTCGGLVFRPDSNTWTLVNGAILAPGWTGVFDAWNFASGSWTPITASYSSATVSLCFAGALLPISNEIVYDAGPASIVGTFNGFKQFGTGCDCNPPGGAAMTVVGSSAPRINATFNVDAANYRSAEPLLLIADVAAAGSAFPLLPIGCSQYVSSLANVTLVNLSPPPGGQSHTVSVPNNASLIGAKLYFQYAQVPNGAFGGCSSNGLEVFIGR